MAADASLLPLPRTGTFDEESCRYFLQEIGEQTVPYYPFIFGINEVYALLLERYGENWVADALSVLHELMEADDNANGLGDDGDIWRSWRHSWRHRNDDPSKPFIPMVRGFVLPLPTAHATRRARAATFSAWIAAPLEAATEASRQSRLISERQPSVEHIDDCREVGGKTVRFQNVPSPGYRREGYEQESDEDEADSQQDFEEVQLFADSIDFDSSQCISFEMLNTPSSQSSEERKLLVLRPIGTAPTRGDSPLSIKHQSRISQRASCQVTNLISPVYSPPNTSPCPLLLPKAVFKGNSASPGDNSQRFIHKTESNHDLPGDFERSNPASPITSGRMAANRHARLIDGAMFHVKPRGVTDRSSPDENKSCEGEVKRSLVRASWSAVRQKDPFRGMRDIFRKDQQQQPQQHAPGHHHAHKRTASTLHHAVDRGVNMPSPEQGITDSSSSPSRPSHLRNHPCGLDGAFDDDIDFPGPSSNLNKALPESPGVINFKKPSSSRTRTPSFDRSQSTPIRPSTASSVSSGISTASSKREFRTMARGLLNEDVTTRRPDLSPVRETVVLSPKKYDPRDSMQSSIYSENSNKGTKPRTALVEDTVPLTPGIPLPLSIRRRDDVESSSEGQWISQSLSSRNTQLSAPSKGYSGSATRRSPAPARYNQLNVQETLLETDTKPRGRSAHRPELVSTTPGSANNPPQTRSRSPVKKFLGQFGKSSSLKNIDGEPRSKSKSTSPEKGSRTPLKSWGNRIRHGFLTADPEIEEVPESTSTPPRKASILASPQSTFPISLDPPYQARILAEIELVICFQANRFLMEEWRAEHLSDESIARTKRNWMAKNRPQVIEFMYDQATQRELITSNLQTIHFHGECGQNPQVLNTTLYNWNSLAAGMAVRTFCSADSAIRKYMHDSHKIIEMFGAPANTFLALQDLQVKTLAKITRKQRERMMRKTEQETSSPLSGSVSRRVGTPTPAYGHLKTSSKGVIELNTSPGFGEAFETYENSRGGRLGMMVRDMVKDNQQG